MKDVSFSLAFFAGLLSFLSPCVLPLVPSYISFITGVSFEDLKSNADRKRIRFLTITNSLTFIAGFSLIFIALGASSSIVGKFLFEYQDWIRIIGGILVIFFGLFVSGVLKLDFLTTGDEIPSYRKTCRIYRDVFCGHDIRRSMDTLHRPDTRNDSRLCKFKGLRCIRI